MNTQRFGIPVIIAAGLHGALFLITPDNTMGDPSPGPAQSLDGLPPLRGEFVQIDPEDPAEDPGGPVSQCVLVPWRLPEPPRVDMNWDDFIVPVTTSAPSIERIGSLEPFVGRPDGIPKGLGDFGHPRLASVDDLDHAPRAVAQPSPLYPEPMRRDGVNGSVTVAFVVDIEGRVVSARVARSTHRGFEDAAVRAVRRWRFEPGTQNGRKVSFRMAVPIEFNAAP